MLLKGSGIVVRVVTTGDKGLGMRFLNLDDKSSKLDQPHRRGQSRRGQEPDAPARFHAAGTAAGRLPAARRYRAAARSRAVPTVSDLADYRPCPSLPAAPSVPRTTQTRMPAAPAPSVPSSTQTRPAATVPAAAPGAPAAKPIQIGDGKLRVVLNAATATFFSYNPLLNIRMGGFFIPVEEEVPLGTTYKVEIVDGQNQTLVMGKGKVVARQELRVGIRLSDVDKDALGRLQALVGKLASSK